MQNRVCLISSLFFLHFFYVVFQSVKALFADYVLDAAGIFHGSFFGNSQFHQTGGDELMAFVDHFGDCSAGIGQINKSGLCHCDMIFLTEIFHSDADT